ncbi:hypothetical protein F5I97DRAFT_1511093 [Phlebopus sp. FC_14]|nr:hypothetical protein F5I97DRAFT_1511093 [Phlebopus sp. FC_14]
MSEPSTDLVESRNAIAQISRGRDVNEDSWMTMWCNANWGDLLQPAPLSIALLGSVMVIASSTDDFSLLSKENKNIKLTYAKYPTSFKTSLQQMVGEGYTAFETASHQMTRIQSASSQLPGVIKSAVTIIVNGAPAEVENLLPIQLEAVTDLTDICMNAAQNCEMGFTRISGLAQEILECATYRIGTAEQNMRRNETHLAILQKEKEQEEQMLKEAKETSDLMKKSFAEAEQEFKSAVNDLPSGWDIVGMHAVESLTGLVTSAGNAILGMANVMGRTTEAFGMAVDVEHTRAHPSITNSTQPSGPALSDPGVPRAQHVLQLATALSLLASGGPGGKPDWNGIRGTGSRSGGLYVEASLERVRERLDKSKPISSKLLPITDKALQIAKNVNAVARTVQSNNDRVLDAYRPKIKKLIQELEGIVTQCNLILQQPGNVATGPATPRPMSASGSATNAKFRVDQTRANLEAARNSYDKASARLINGQKEIAQTIASMTSLSLTNATLKDMLPVLVKAVKTFTTLRSQFSQLTQFFCNVASLIKDVMKPQVSTWTKSMEANSRMVLAGVTLSDWVRQAMYSQMMIPLKVSMLSERIAQTYLRVSDLYILPAQREVGHMLRFQEDRSESGKAQFAAKLAEAQAKIQEKSELASQKIVQLVAEDQRKFAQTINRRLESITSSVARALPGISEPPPRQITDVTEAHVEEFDERREEIEKARPAYDIDDLM